MDNRPPITERAVVILRHLLSAPEGEHTAADVARTTGVPPVTTVQILARLASFEWVVQQPGIGTGRPYRLTDEGIAGARESVRRSASGSGSGKVLTMAQLREAVDRGEETPEFLAAVRRALDRER